MLILLSWLIIVIILAYLISFEFPILFKQRRLGRGGKSFMMWKFRTLKSDVNSPISERKFWMGNFLRATSLDEVPQMWNILKGEMSWIGPRPMPIEYEILFSRVQKERFTVKPGITGWAQVNGRHSISWKEKFDLDQYYVHHLSPVLDCRIFLRTIVLLLSFKKDISLEEPSFKGN